MILLDTDHITVLSFSLDRRHAALSAQINAVTDESIATTVVSVAEPLRGWMAEINRHKSAHGKIPAFGRLAQLIRFFADWAIIPLESPAADRFEELRRSRIRIGTLDLLIASIAITQNALLLSANLSDFRKVPGLRVENWLTP